MEKIEIDSGNGGSDKKGLPPYEGEGTDATLRQRKGSVADPEALAGEIFDPRFEQTKRGLKSRHAQMIALGGTIGTGMFVGTGQTLARGGPAFIFGCFIVVSFLIYCIVTAIAEVAAFLPTPGSSMNLFGYRYVSRSLGFAMGWLYFYSLGILVPYEITAAALVIQYWNSPVHIAVWITIFIVIIIGLNALPVQYYGETEFWFAGIKVIMIFGLLIMSVVLFFGGGPSHDRLGFRYWQKPGAAKEYLETGDTGRFLALLSTLVLSAFPFAFAPEMMVVTAGEMKSPRRNLPIAARRYIFRLVFFYILSVLAMSVICPSNDPAITSDGAGAGASPFVVGIRNAGIKSLDSVINAGILISAWSSGNGFLYLSSRSLYSLALSGNAPKIFKTCTKKGVPYMALIASSCFCALSYLNVGDNSAVVFNWFVNLTNTSAFISWMCCCIVLLRFRKACAVQGVPDSALPFHSKLQPVGSWIALGSFGFLTLINGFHVFWPQNWSASSFLTAYIGIPIFLAIYFGHRFIWAWNDTWAYNPAETDLTTGMDQVLAEEKPPKPARGPKYISWVQKLWT
ncbi:AAT family amino acid transporter, variant [Eremomyces bilateralis CBS 781.70]|uniref:AAT family amino acid transporter, variant n=1 Tax=Eremomyces bilateralis CBS 781.70 TaxID=1392243 RepID=A0A6G1GD21_9PEZI|nr:AAT family amino acid transporter, variant [Eremomyces bilateralis CBS 781.70]KAF1815987.1 AAT family amino acid transporter, variant [Eremomyces bilateralis CBS 781.70]